MDKLNSLSYAYHYRNIDSTDYYACKAFKLAENYREVQAEALNNRAFVSTIRMHYDMAQRQLDSIPLLSDNQIELLVCYVQQMRLCQRCSRNKDFYDYRERALSALNRINEERDQLNDCQLQRLLYAETELAIVTSTYYYYVGLERQSVEALNVIDPSEVKRDTAQFLNYLYNVGAGGILVDGDAAGIWQQEMDHLLRCFQIAQRGDYPYFAANALEAIAEHLIAPPDSVSISLSLVNPDQMADDELSVWLAEEALRIFQDYGDVYQTAGAYRTLASCYRAQGEYELALQNLELSLADTLINQAPDLVASIREQLSVVYAAVDEKPSSDYNRNLYLDLQEQTRQDRQLEARVERLNQAVAQLNWMLAALALAILLLLSLLWLFRKLGHRQKKNSLLDDQIEERREQLAVNRLHVEEGERRHLEQRAKVSLVNSLLPLIDRMVYTINRNGDKSYVSELISQIEADNELLTQWIQLQQGQLSLHIESFPLQPLFDIVMSGQKSFQIKKLTLSADSTSVVVKADRILTLFMLNTLADNARKFTPEGGAVRLSATEGVDYVEISVSDTGIGMDEETLAHVFDHKTIKDDKLHTSHGFGLLNCKGIIEKYRKLSQLFSVCTFEAESEEGKGSRFFFRLPKGVVRALVFAGLLLYGLSGAANPVAEQARTPLSRAAIYADSAFFSNINGTFERTLLFADSCRRCLNEHYLSQCPQGTLLMLNEGNMANIPPEIQWLHNAVNINYNIILDIRNESAVAALALHKWTLYSYNNRIYTQLFKELSADASLSDYCRTIQQTKANRTIAVVLLVLVLLAILLAYYFYYLHPRLSARFKAEQLRRTDLELLDDELRRTEIELANLHVSNAVLDNCLSTLKHETMYYPSRIRQLINQGDLESAREVVYYYRELYNLLSLQAMSQVERVKLHLKPLKYDILGDETLVRYLFDILKKQAGRKLDLKVERRDDKYVEIMTQVPHLPRIDYLLCRQIVRDHGEATNRRACSIRQELKDNITTIIIILPAYGKL